MILFITRKYPPTIGGMEKFSFELIESVRKKKESYRVTWGRSQKWFLFFYPYLLIKSYFILLFKPVKVIHLGDAVLAPIGLILKVLFQIPVAVTVHGKDVTYNNMFYQYFVPRFLRNLDLVVTVSDKTKEEVIKRGIDRTKVSVIPNGVMIEEFPDLTKNENYRPLYDIIGKNLDDKIVLITVGRLIRRKGFIFFVTNVLPNLPDKEKYFYIICGQGPDYNLIKEAVVFNRLEDNVCLVGQIPNEMLDLVYRRADIFIMPNVPCPGDMEGFGLVVLEACMYELPVVASNLEGITNALYDQENGYLVDTRDYDSFIRIIDELKNDLDKRKKIGKKAHAFVIENFNWEHISDQYIEQLDKLIEIG